MTCPLRRTSAAGCALNRSPFSAAPFSAAAGGGGALERMGYVAPDDLSSLCTGELPKRDALFQRARNVLPGGVTAAGRFRSALGAPFYIARGHGSKLIDVDGREYIDLSNSHGGGVLGHDHPAIRAALLEALDVGTICSMDTEAHVELAELVCQTVPAFSQLGGGMLRYTGSGTEAVMHTIRIARTFTGRDRIVKFEGHYHGMNDYLQYNWPPAPTPLRTPGERVPLVPTSGGMVSGIEDYITVLPWNDAEAVARELREHGDEIAAVILEPINYNGGATLPDPGFLETLKRQCEAVGVLLIFDEVLSCYKTSADCAQGYLGVTPDLTILGKAVGGGKLTPALTARVIFHSETVCP